jgi:hypothetical protein
LRHQSTEGALLSCWQKDKERHGKIVHVVIPVPVIDTSGELVGD